MPAIREVNLRHAQHYFERLQSLATPDSTGLPLSQRLDQLRPDWAQITTAQAWCADNFESDDAVAEICSYFAYVGIDGTGQAVCEFLQSPIQRIEWIASALSAARKTNDKKMVAVHLTHHGMTNLEIGQTDAALKAYSEAEKAFAELEAWESQAVTWDSMGIIFDARGDFQKALDFYSRAQQAYHGLGLLSHECKSLKWMADCCVKLG